MRLAIPAGANEDAQLRPAEVQVLKKFKVYDQDYKEVIVWAFKNQESFQACLAREGASLLLDNPSGTPSWRVDDFDDIVAEDDDELNDGDTHRYRIQRSLTQYLIQI